VKEKVAVDAELRVREKPKFVGRGGLKLEGALEEFGIDVTDWICLDTGASTGGFTDCLLQRGAERVHAVDVGTNQLVYSLRIDPRVMVKEKFNSRYLTEEDLGECVDLAVLDLSFISLTKVLPAIFSVLKVNKIRSFVTEEQGRAWRGLVESSIKGTDGNVEYLAWF